MTNADVCIVHLIHQFKYYCEDFAAEIQPSWSYPDSSQSWWYTFPCEINIVKHNSRSVGNIGVSKINLSFHNFTLKALSVVLGSGHLIKDSHSSVSSQYLKSKRACQWWTNRCTRLCNITFKDVHNLHKYVWQLPFTMLPFTSIVQQSLDKHEAAVWTNKLNKVGSLNKQMNIP